MKPSCVILRFVRMTPYATPAGISSLFTLFQKERRLVDQSVVLEITAQIGAIRVLPDDCLPDNAFNVVVARKEITR